MQRDHIGLVDILRIDILARLNAGQRADAVAIERCLLEGQIGARLLHVSGDLALHLLAVAGQEVARLIDQPVVVFAGDAPDAGGAAALDLKKQTGPRARSEHRVRAGAQQKRALHQRQGFVDGAGRGEGTEIFAFPAPRAAMLDDLRPFMVARDQDVGEGLVVLEQDVVARPELLDQVRFEQQCLDLGVGRHHFHARGLGDHAA